MNRLGFTGPLDEGVQEVLAMEGDTSLPAERVIRLGNGLEFLADRVAILCADRVIALRYIHPGQPNRKAFLERFNRTVRHEVCDKGVFESLDQLRDVTAQWRREYNEERLPLSSQARMIAEGSPSIRSP